MLPALPFVTDYYFHNGVLLYTLCFLFAVHIRHKEIVIYPDDESKPQVGEGLNRPAQVTLDRVWPIDKTTRVPIVDAERLARMDYEDTLRRACDKNNTRFKEYRPQTGSWVFKVCCIFIALLNPQSQISL